VKPPACSICSRRFDPAHEGDDLRFKRRPDDERWHARGVKGHPPDAAWFCGTHAKAARALTDRTLPEALAELRGT